MVEFEVVQANPFGHIRPTRRKDQDSYPALDIPEIERLLEAAPPERADIYRLAYATGLRRGELRQLRCQDVRLDLSPPRVVVRAAVAKNRRAQDVPVPPWSVAMLTRMVGAKEPRDLLIEPWPHDRKFRRDFDAAALYAPRCFHSLRKSYVTHLARKGVEPATLQRLARHSDPRLTANVYTDARLLPLAGAVSALPDVGCGDSAKILEISGGQSGDGRYLHGVQAENPHLDEKAPGGVLAHRPAQSIAGPRPGPSHLEYRRQESNLSPAPGRQDTTGTTDGPPGTDALTLPPWATDHGGGFETQGTPAGTGRQAGAGDSQSPLSPASESASPDADSLSPLQGGRVLLSSTLRGQPESAPRKDDGFSPSSGGSAPSGADSLSPRALADLARAERLAAENRRAILRGLGVLGAVAAAAAVAVALIPNEPPRVVVPGWPELQ